MGSTPHKPVTFQAGGVKFEIHKSRLKEWVSLDELQIQIIKNPSAKGIYEYLTRATGREEDFWEKLSWIETSEAYLSISIVNKLGISIPLIEVGDGSPAKSIPWDYPGRAWFVWLNMFAKEYGWSGEYIAELEVEDAFALFQEIETEKQLKREWDWQLTELAYPYNSATKKSEFHALERPVWMKIKVGPPKVSKMRRDLMPVGNVVDLMHYVEPNPSH